MTNQRVLHFRYYVASLTGCLGQGNGLQYQQVPQYPYGISTRLVSFILVHLPQQLQQAATFGRKDGCSNITELLRNFCTRQSLPWIAKLRLSTWYRIVGGYLLTSIRYFGNLVAVETVPR